MKSHGLVRKMLDMYELAALPKFDDRHDDEDREGL